ncbi:MAG TPA: hypothetical protein VFO55_06695 [Gemmatimonadaceae bacterium]|nr:hypothetical protein [Gemmatimonadaceae bacterium]
MDQKRDGFESVRLDEAAARRLIERATELDAKLASESTVAELREAARGAGISDEAFQRALAEVRHEGPAAADPDALFDINRRHPWRRVVAALVIGLLVATTYVFLRATPRPIGAAADEAVPAAPAVPGTPAPTLPPPR